MFEKESVEYLKKEGAKSAQIFSTMLEEAPLQITSKQIPYIFATVAQAFQDGAEYGYNKALEEATHNYNAIIADYDKRIVELEKENAELKESNKMLEQGYVWHDYDAGEDCYEDTHEGKWVKRDEVYYLTEIKELLKNWVNRNS